MRLSTGVLLLFVNITLPPCPSSADAAGTGRAAVEGRGDSGVDGVGEPGGRSADRDRDGAGRGVRDGVPPSGPLERVLGSAGAEGDVLQRAPALLQLGSGALAQGPNAPHEGVEGTGARPAWRKRHASAVHQGAPEAAGFRCFGCTSDAGCPESPASSCGRSFPDRRAVARRRTGGCRSRRWRWADRAWRRSWGCRPRR